MAIIFGRKGNEWEWRQKYKKKRPYENPQQLLKKERRWRNWAFGLPVFLVLGIVLIISGLYLFNAYREKHYSPMKISFTRIITSNGSGGSNFGIGSDGSLLAWGYNYDGILGDGSKTNIKQPKTIISSGVKDVVANLGHAFAIKTDGSLWGWGDNEGNQLGNGDEYDQDKIYKPEQIIPSGVTDVVIAGDGSSSTFAIKTDGSLWGWGYNDYCELGDGTKLSQPTPEQIISDGVKKVVSNQSRTFVLKDDGSLWAWGRNANELGIDTKSTDVVCTPEQVFSGGVKDVVMDSDQSDVFLIKTDDSLWAWGKNDSGQLGDGTKEDVSVPEQIIDSGVKKVVQHGGDTFIIKDDGSLWGWGFNDFGELGDGTTLESLKPKQIISSGVAELSGNSIVKTDGSLWVWGWNTDGQIGDGTKSDEHKIYKPIQVIASGVAESIYGGDYVLALKTDGSLWAWGYNGSGSLWPWPGGESYGDLGDGTAINRFIPKQITLGGGLTQSLGIANQTDTGNISSQTSTAPASTADTAVDFSCGTSTVQDADGNNYNTVQVGTQCWMATDMKVGKKIDASKDQVDDGNIEKWCPKNITDNCKTYGGLYTWDEAMQYSTTEGAQGICPSGWHIPTDAEQYTLENYLVDAGQVCDANRSIAGCESAGTKLLSGGTSGLNFPLSGFYYNGTYSGRDASVNFWSSSEIDSVNARDRLIYSDNSTIVRDTSLKENGFSVRCIED